tara:strand:+ start:80 stop:688 length:609 start_codon:yes stop_codon:yes gene_type:complete
MSDIMALDIETGNYSHEIGGWDKTALFEPTVVATWDGTNGHIFTNMDVQVEGVNHYHPLHPRDLGDHLQKHVEGGGKILGHNLLGFDLPVLNDALDCYYAGELMRNSEHIIDTSRMMSKLAGHRVPLDDVCKHTLGLGKTAMTSDEAPLAWREGRYDDVADYCLKDCKLVYDLYRHGQVEGLVKARHVETGLVTDYGVEWNE